MIQGKFKILTNIITKQEISWLSYSNFSFLSYDVLLAYARCKLVDLGSNS